MKKLPLFSHLILLGLLASCQSQYGFEDEVVCETVHQYGVPLEYDDWKDRGQNGQVFSVRKDGVGVRRNYQEGILHGECEYSFPHRDEIQKRETYHQGTLMGECFYYQNGLPHHQVMHESPTKQSRVVWYENGAPQAREEFLNENIVQGEYYTLNNQVESRIEDANGLRTIRDGQGRLQSVDTIQKGQMTLRTELHPNGTPAALTPYVQGRIQGERRTFLPGGEPSTVEQWENHKQHGNTIVFEQGEKRAEVPYVNGLKHGTEHRFRDEEKVVQEIPWVKGEQHGPSYNYVGNRKQEVWYYRNRPVPNKQTFEMLSNQ